MTNTGPTSVNDVDIDDNDYDHHSANLLEHFSGGAVGDDLSYPDAARR